ncbi:unnamed protein product [Gordionus sp. m RMFG-2023]
MIKNPNRAFKRKCRNGTKIWVFKSRPSLLTSADTARLWLIEDSSLLFIIDLVTSIKDDSVLSVACFAIANLIENDESDTLRNYMIEQKVIIKIYISFQSNFTKALIDNSALRCSLYLFYYLTKNNEQGRNQFVQCGALDYFWVLFKIIALYLGNISLISELQRSSTDQLTSLWILYNNLFKEILSATIIDKFTETITLKLIFVLIGVIIDTESWEIISSSLETLSILIPRVKGIAQPSCAENSYGDMMLKILEKIYVKLSVSYNLRNNDILTKLQQRELEDLYKEENLNLGIYSLLNYLKMLEHTALLSRIYPHFLKKLNSFDIIVDEKEDMSEDEKTLQDDNEIELNDKNESPLLNLIKCMPKEEKTPPSNL